jgi:glycosyltransferase involved in cell wall biosynthesis
MYASIDGLSVVIPACNEREGIGRVLDSLSLVLKQFSMPTEVIVVDDGSRDGTHEFLNGRKDIRFFRHEKRLGYGRSLKSGLRESRYETIAILDADGTYPPEALPRLLEAYQGCDMAVGWRGSFPLPSGVLPRSTLRRFLHGLAWYLCGARIPDLNSGYRIFRRRFWEEHQNEFPAGFSFTTTLTLLAHFSGRPPRYVSIEYKPRVGMTKVDYFRDGLRVAGWMVRLTWRYRPARVLFPIFVPLVLVFIFVYCK